MTLAIDSIRAGWIGVGKMGAPMCRNLLKAGVRLSVFDVVEEPVRELVQLGATAAASIEVLARQSDVVISMVPNDAVLLDLVSAKLGLAAEMSAGSTFVDMSTVSPLRSAQVAEQLKGRNVGYVRAPVSGSTANAAAATLSIFCSGDRAVCERVEPLLATLGRRITYCGDAEEARVLKLLVNIIVNVTPALVGEALAFGLKSGLGRDEILDAISASAGASPVINYKLDMLRSRDWSPMATIDTAAKDLALALEWAKASEVPLPFTALAQRVNTAFQIEGSGSLDFFAVSEWPERSAELFDPS